MAFPSLSVVRGSLARVGASRGVVAVALTVGSVRHGERSGVVGDGVGVVSKSNLRKNYETTRILLSSNNAIFPPTPTEESVALLRTGRAVTLVLYRRQFRLRWHSRPGTEKRFELLLTLTVSSHFPPSQRQTRVVGCDLRHWSLLPR
jgi:hypothetical protein